MPVPAYCASDVRAADAYAIERLGIPGYTLMTRAGEAALGALRSRWPLGRRLLIVCGTGNNGGDGWALARFARAAGLTVTVTAPGGFPRTGDALRAFSDWQMHGGVHSDWHVDLLSSADVVVDALFGTGIDRPVTAPWMQVVQAINDSRRPVCALDIPSGLDADTGQVWGEAVHADLTVTFVGLKAGLYLAEGPDYSGTILFDSLDVPDSAFAGREPRLLRTTELDLRMALPRRARTANKGRYGHVLVIAGGPGMPGAARLTAEAALRSGAGLVTVACHPSSAPAIAAGRAEAICEAIEHPSELDRHLENADLVAIGPGLGQSEWAHALFRKALQSDRALVVDADALNLLAKAPSRNPRWCLTPHPGEAARLLAESPAFTGAGGIQADRLGAVRALQARYDGIAVLKGAGTLVAGPAGPPWLCDRGNPGMAAAGMGDVLTGIIAGIAAQQPLLARDPSATLALAARVGVFVHALAGDLAARGGERGLIASDLILQLPACVNPAS
jgi:ADP-dependent NAD(P)H-hydrate dehydratase / NAD(P)H-hydrate epimerase